ncbi:chromatin assembly factor 1 subunit A-like [Ornithodoros turicata]|uniref:chromatin assembly factor 1 subunit A-like n=1 Tax=Ornithodoros turicata TaxID=34597 RepID=UPI003139EC1B
MEASTPAGKLKQSRLPFQTLAVSPVQIRKKRKLPVEDATETPSKSPRVDGIENIPNQVEAEVKIIEDENEDCAVEKPANNSVTELDDTSNTDTANGVETSQSSSAEANSKTPSDNHCTDAEVEAVAPDDAPMEVDQSHAPEVAAVSGPPAPVNVTKDDSSIELRDNTEDFNNTAATSILDDTVSTVSDDLNSSVVSTSAADESCLSRSRLSEPSQKSPKESSKPLSKSRKAVREKVSQQKKEEKEKSRLEKEAAKEQKKQLLEQKRKEKQQQLEEKRQQKEEKQKLIEERRKEIEEKKKEREQRHLELMQEKEDLKRMKVERQAARLEELKKKEEDKKQKLEEKKRAEEEEMKEKQKLKEAFASFFVKKTKTSSRESMEHAPDSVQGMFRPFELKQDMKLAPVVPVVALERFNKETLDQEMKRQDTPPDSQYLKSLQTGKARPIKISQRLKKSKEEEDKDVIVVEVENSRPREQLRAKLLQFCENVRPPYWGTWRKPMERVDGRRPFAKHTVLDYEVDSDEEWEEEEPGESLSGTEEEKESEDDYEVDNEFFVPHGYLSEDEEKNEDEPVSPESMKARLKARQEEFQADLKKSCKALQPLIVGCIWLDKPTSTATDTAHPLARYTAVILTAEVPIPASTEAEQNASTPPTVGKGPRARAIPQEAMPHLIRMVHGNSSNKMVILKEFTAFWEDNNALKDTNSSSSAEQETKRLSISKRQFVNTIRNIARYNGSCWVVNQETLDKYELSDLKPLKKSVEKQDEPKESPKPSMGALDKFLTVSPSLKQNLDESNGKSPKEPKKTAKGALSKLFATLPSNKKEGCPPPAKSAQGVNGVNAAQEPTPNENHVGTSSDPIVLDENPLTGDAPVEERKNGVIKNPLTRYFAKLAPAKLPQNSKIVEGDCNNMTVEENITA